MMGVDRLPPARSDKLIPAESYGVKVMSIGFLVKPDQPLIWRGPMLHSAIRQFLSDVEWGELDYLVVDLPPGTGDAALSLAQSLPLSGGLIVTLPQEVSLEDARRGMEMFRQLDVPILGVVENMSYLELPDGTRMDVLGQVVVSAWQKRRVFLFLERSQWTRVSAQVAIPASRWLWLSPNRLLPWRCVRSRKMWQQKSALRH
jgi:Mrp family chromosome partitioning ATPase